MSSSGYSWFEDVVLITGAQFILSYFTPQALDWLSEEDPEL
jgi:hypothetical protein